MSSFITSYGLPRQNEVAAGSRFTFLFHVSLRSLDGSAHRGFSHRRKRLRGIVLVAAQFDPPDTVGDTFDCERGDAGVRAERAAREALTARTFVGQDLTAGSEGRYQRDQGFQCQMFLQFFHNQFFFGVAVRAHWPLPTEEVAKFVRGARPKSLRDKELYRIASGKKVAILGDICSLEVARARLLA